MQDERWRELAQKASGGDGGAFEELYKASKRSVYFICLKMTGNEDDAKDAVQNTYLTAYQKLPELDDGANFIKWVNGIAANKCREIFRTKKDDSLDEKIDEGIEFRDEEFIPEDYVSDAVKRKAVMHIIESELTDVQRQTVILYYYNQMTVSQISQVMECTESAVKYRLCSAREKIREAVLIYEKEHGDRLHAIVPIPVLTQIFRAEADQISVPDIPLHLPKAVQNPAGNIIKNAGGNQMNSAFIGKIIAVAVTAAVAGAGVSYATSGRNSSRDRDDDRPAVSEVTTSVTEAVTEAPVTVTTTAVTTAEPVTTTTEVTTTETTTAAPPVNEHEGQDYNMWTLDPLEEKVYLWFDESFWQVRRNLGQNMGEPRMSKSIVLTNEDCKCQVHAIKKSWQKSNEDFIADWAEGSFQDYIKENINTHFLWVDMDKSDFVTDSIETKEINGIPVIISHQTGVYNQDFGCEATYTNYIFVFYEDEGKAVTLSVGLYQWGADAEKNELTEEEYMKIIGSMDVKDINYYNPEMR